MGLAQGEDRGQGPAAAGAPGPGICSLGSCPLALVGIRLLLTTRCVCVCVCSVTQWCPLFAIPWTVACQAPLSMGFPRQEYWSRLPFPIPGHLPDPGIKPASLVPPALAGGFFTTALLGKPFFWNLYSEL